jgi:nucleotide-binding universal stress UspA family protein
VIILTAFTLEFPAVNGSRCREHQKAGQIAPPATVLADTGVLPPWRSIVRPDTPFRLEARLMNAPASLLCPIDYSDASAGALRRAAAIAEHFSARLIVLTVEDPLLTSAMDLGTGFYYTPAVSREEMEEFVTETLGSDRGALRARENEVAIGKPPVEILRIAHERACDLIVMSSHGLTGARKLFFGSTTERVLRETTVPVLVTPATDGGPVHEADAAKLIRRIVVPIDLSSASGHQTQIASRIAQTLNVPLLLVHVIEPLRGRLLARHNVSGLNASRRALAEERLNELVARIPKDARPEALIAYGDPAEETAKVVRDRGAGLVVMGLHGSPLLGPRMGSVTYRILCLCSVAVLALPPDTLEPTAAG